MQKFASPSDRQWWLPIYEWIISGVARSKGCVRLLYGQGSGGSSRDLESAYTMFVIEKIMPQKLFVWCCKHPETKFHLFNYICNSKWIFLLIISFPNLFFLNVYAQAFWRKRSYAPEYHRTGQCFPSFGVLFYQDFSLFWDSRYDLKCLVTNFNVLKAGVALTMLNSLWKIGEINLIIYVKKTNLNLCLHCIFLKLGFKKPYILLKICK